jgi:hypothetical protein
MLLDDMKHTSLYRTHTRLQKLGTVQRTPKLGLCSRAGCSSQLSSCTRVCSAVASCF